MSSSKLCLLRSQPPGNMFQCGTCSQSYTRVDHLLRHVRSHTQEKPYQCTVCDKRFGRVDLLSRHASLHNTDAEQVSGKRRRTGDNSTPAVRASQACAACAENHLRCEDQKPCRRCQRKNIPCRVPNKSAGGILTPVEQLDSSANDRMPALGPDSVSAEQHTSFSPETMPPQFWSHQIMGDGQQVAAEETLALSNDQGNFLTAESGDLFSGAFSNLPSGTRTPRGLINFGLETNLDLSAIDLNFLDTYNTRIPFELEEPPRSIDHLDPDGGKDTDGRGVRSLQKSIWRFVPAPQDHGFAEYANLSLPTQVGSTDTPESLVDLARRPTTERLDFPSRDKILSIVLSQVRPSISRAVSSFPSVELLDSLIEYFLAVPFSGASAWVHSAGFHPKRTRPELLLAMAAAGAVLTPDPALRKLGFAMQEVVRNHLPTVFEGDNTLIRDLELQQAFMLHLEIGLWSGNSRKIEISESFQQPLLTMLRRGGMFIRSGYPSISVRPEDRGQVLEEKWCLWIKQESFKRLVYHLLQHDAQSSMALLISPLISYAEVNLPLPEPLQLWSASSAQEWKTLYCSQCDPTSMRIPSLTECIANLDLLESSRSVSDLRMSCLAVLHAMWGLVWEHGQLSLVLRNQPRYWDSGLLMTSRYQELIKMLGYFRIGYKNESTLLLELILMHMHMSLDEIQLFAGLGDPGDAGSVQPFMKEWAKSKASRQAMWHAGQVIREVKLLPSQNLRDFKAVALYHASLTLWAYGLVSRMVDPHHSGLSSLPSAPKPQEQQKVWLDGEETDDVHKYIALERGMPMLQAIQAGMPPAHLSDPRAILEVVLDVMQQNHSEPFKQQPPLVENLIHLIRRLRDVTK